MFALQYVLPEAVAPLVVWASAIIVIITALFAIRKLVHYIGQKADARIARVARKAIEGNDKGEPDGTA